MFRFFHGAALVVRDQQPRVIADIHEMDLVDEIKRLCAIGFQAPGF